MTGTFYHSVVCLDLEYNSIYIYIYIYVCTTILDSFAQKNVYNNTLEKTNLENLII